MATTTDFDYLYKILLIGNVSVGKTTFLTRYIKNYTNKNQAPTLGVEYQTNCIILQNGTVIKAQIWDTSGSEKYKSITTAHYRKSVGALLFYDITDKKSFQDTLNWLHEIKDHTDESIVIMLIGNKSDIVEENPSKRAVSIEEAKDFASKYNLLFIETSAKQGTNVKEAFKTLVETVYEEQSKNNQDANDEYMKQIKIKRDGTIGPNPNNNKQSEGCCGN